MPVMLATDYQIRRPAAGSPDQAGQRSDFRPCFLRACPKIHREGIR